MLQEGRKDVYGIYIELVHSFVCFFWQLALMLDRYIELISSWSTHSWGASLSIMLGEIHRLGNLEYVARIQLM